MKFSKGEPVGVVMSYSVQSAVCAGRDGKVAYVDSEKGLYLVVFHNGDWSFLEESALVRKPIAQLTVRHSDALDTIPAPSNVANEYAGGFRKADSGKIAFSILPFDALGLVARVMMFGAKKYERDNWRKAEGDDVRRYEDAMLRHYEEYQRGEGNDPESGLPHLAHLACDALFLLWHRVCKP